MFFIFLGFNFASYWNSHVSNREQVKKTTTYIKKHGRSSIEESASSAHTTHNNSKGDSKITKKELFGAISKIDIEASPQFPTLRRRKSDTMENHKYKSEEGHKTLMKNQRIPPKTKEFPNDCSRFTKNKPIPPHMVSHATEYEPIQIRNRRSLSESTRAYDEKKPPQKRVPIGFDTILSTLRTTEQEEKSKLINRTLSTDGPMEILDKCKTFDEFEKYFKKRGKVGMGHSSQVYLYEYKNFKVAVRIEEFDSSYSRKLATKEVSIYKILQKHPHPNIAQTYKIFDSMTSALITVMEFVEGIDLEHFFHFGEIDGIRKRDVIAITRQLLSAFRHVRSLNMVHNDLAMCNILISKTGIVKVIDFAEAVIINEPIKYHDDKILRPFQKKDDIGALTSFRWVITPTNDFLYLGFIVLSMISCPFNNLTDSFHTLRKHVLEFSFNTGKLEYNGSSKFSLVREDSIPPEFRELINGLLNLDYKERIGYTLESIDIALQSLPFTGVEESLGEWKKRVKFNL